jgi:hypothetical protein
MMAVADHEAMTEDLIWWNNDRGHFQKKRIATLKVVAGSGSILLEH